MDIFNRFSKSIFYSLFLNFVFFLFAALWGSVRAQVVFTEIMYHSSGSDFHDEFIELFNLSYTDSINLGAWSLRDSVSSDILTDAGYGLNLAPRQFAVILDASYFDNSTLYDAIIPDSALKITISDRSFTKSGLSNSKPKTLFLYDDQNNLVQEYRYSIDNDAGYSDEKIAVDGCNSDDNWGNSTVLNGTPGFHNSISPYDKDIGFLENCLRYQPSTNIKLTQEVRTNLVFRNFGIADFRDSVLITLYLDRDRDTLYNNDDVMVFSGSSFLDIRSGDEQNVEIIWQAPSIGSFLLTAKFVSGFDQNKVNNCCLKPIVIVDNKSSIKISEIKFLTDINEKEWIELYNSGDYEVSLKDWAIADNKDTVLVDTLISLFPDQYKIFTASESLSTYYSIADSLVCVLSEFPTLNNDKDAVYLINPAGGWEEQVPYTLEWLEGEDWCSPSLERISFTSDSRSESNWGPAVNEERATPASENSIHQKTAYQTADISIHPNPFSPDGDGFEDYCIIQVHSPASIARAEIVIYDIVGRRITSLEEVSFHGNDFETIWNGRDENGKRVRMGVYIVHLRLLDDKNGLIEEKKETIVVAGEL